MSALRRFYHWLLSGPFDVVMGVAIVAIGVAIAPQNGGGSNDFIENVLHVPMTAFVAVMIVSGLLMALQCNASTYAILSTTLGVYAALLLWYSLHQTFAGKAVSYAPGVATLGFYCLGWWVNHRRIKHEHDKFAL